LSFYLEKVLKKWGKISAISVWPSQLWILWNFFKPWTFACIMSYAVVWNNYNISI
jgi:hypothetical protein